MHSSERYGIGADLMEAPQSTAMLVDTEQSRKAAGSTAEMADQELPCSRQQQQAGSQYVPGAAPSGVFAQREQYLIKREAEGELAFVYVENDGVPEHSMWLVGLKNIFSRQLPNMPKEYIARLVLDRRHRSCAIVRPGSAAVLGGITYRPFHAQRFGEIAFCAVTALEQVKGFGTRLMNHTKELARERDGLSHFLTYADNNAVGYFAKQGFTRDITLERERWLGFIKDYDGGTLMECVIHPRLPHIAFPAMVAAQRAALDRQIRTLSNAHVVHPGLPAFHQPLTAQHLQQQPRPTAVDISDIPGVAEAGWMPEQAEAPQYRLLLDRTLKPATPENLQHFMGRALGVLRALDDSWPFREPVDAAAVLDYYDIIKDPVDLSLIQQRLDSRSYYRTLDMFVADIHRVCTNARIYNSADTIYFKLANKLDAFFDEIVHANIVYEQI